MAEKLMEKVVADRERFSIRLGVQPSVFDKVGKPALTGSACAAAGALVAAHVVGPATVIKILGITLYASSGPVGWAVGAGVAAFGAGYAAHVLGREINERFGTTGTYKKEFDGSLSEIGMVVADIVFRPMTALALSGWNEARRDYILQEFDRWGYDGEWAKGYVAGLQENGGDVLGPTVEIVSQKGFGGRAIRDKAIGKRNLVDRAIEKLGDAASEFDGAGWIVQEKKEQILRRLEEGYVD